jgi:hypothetical protein
MPGVQPGEAPARRPWRWLAVVPAAAVLLAPYVANRVEPRILGLPFLLAFITGWVVVTSVVMAVIYQLDDRADAHEGAHGDGPAVETAAP